MVSIEENRKRLEKHFTTGYTQYVKFARSFTGEHLANDLVSDTYLLVRKAIENGGCNYGVTHYYIIRAIKLNHYDQKKLKRSYDNYDRIDMGWLDFGDEYYYDPHEEMNELERRLIRELNFKVVETYVENHFNLVEQSMFKLKYTSGFSNKEIARHFSQEKYNYSESKISLIFKRITQSLIQHFNPKK